MCGGWNERKLWLAGPDFHASISGSGTIVSFTIIFQIFLIINSPNPTLNGNWIEKHENENENWIGFRILTFIPMCSNSLSMIFHRIVFIMLHAAIQPTIEGIAERVFDDLWFPVCLLCTAQSWLAGWLAHSVRYVCCQPRDKLFVSILFHSDWKIS